MHPTPLWVTLALGLTACASSRVVTTPSPVPVSGSPIRYALRSDPYRFATRRMISLNVDTLTFDRLAPDTMAFGRFARGDRTVWITDRIPTDSIAPPGSAPWQHPWVARRVVRRRASAARRLYRVVRSPQRQITRR